MFDILSICDNSSLDPIWKIVGWVINAIWIGVPILLIVLGTIDLAKAVITSKDDEKKKAWKSLTTRFLYAIGVFAVVWMVTLVLGLLAKIDNGDINYNESWKACWNKIKSSN